MTDYTRQRDFTAKDNLATGSGGKVVLGADFDAEYDAVLTAVNSKFDQTDVDSGDIVVTNTTNPGVEEVDQSYLPSATTTVEGITEYASNAETVAGTDTAKSIRPSGLTHAFENYTNNIVTAGNVTVNGSFSATGSVALATGAQINSNDIWHAGNDGASSGLDADLLDGEEKAFFRDSSNQNAGTLDDARLSSNVPLKDGDNTFSARNRVNVVSLTPVTTPSTTDIDASLSNCFLINLDRDVEFSLSNNSGGQTILLRIRQDTTARTVTFPGGWLWPAGIVPTVSTGSGAEDLLTLTFFGTRIYATLTQDLS